MANFLIAATLLSGCSSRSHEYTVNAPEGHSVYKIGRPGGFIRDEDFDVVLVYGFNDNLAVAQQIVEFLNREEPATYFLSEAK
jgi:hypothetical protein